MAKYPVVVTTYHGASEVLDRCISSLPPGTEYTVINTSEHGLAEGWNRAVEKYKDSPAIIITNDDVVFEPDSVNLLGDYLCEGQFKIPSPRESLVVKAFDKLCRKYYSPQDLEPYPRYWPNEGWFCFSTNKKLIDVCGPFDETWPAYFEDADMSYRIWKAGYCAMSYAGVYHENSYTTRKDPVLAAYIEKIKPLIKAYFIKKHGEYPSEGPIFLEMSTYEF